MLQWDGPMGEGTEERLWIRTRGGNESSRRIMVREDGNRGSVVVKIMRKENRCMGHKI